MNIFTHTDSFDKVGSRIEFRSQWPGVADGNLEKEYYAFGPLQSFDRKNRQPYVERCEKRY